MIPVPPLSPEDLASAKLAANEQVVVLCADGVCKHEPRHIPLPVFRIVDERGTWCSRWSFTDAERLLIESGADLYIWLDSPAGHPPILPTLQPMLFGPKCPNCSHSFRHNRAFEIMVGPNEASMYLGHPDVLGCRNEVRSSTGQMETFITIGWGCPFCDCRCGWKQ